MFLLYWRWKVRPLPIRGSPILHIRGWSKLRCRWSWRILKPERMRREKPSHRLLEANRKPQTVPSWMQTGELEQGRLGLDRRARQCSQCVWDWPRWEESVLDDLQQWWLLCLSSFSAGWQEWGEDLKWGDEILRESEISCKSKISCALLSNTVKAAPWEGRE